MTIMLTREEAQQVHDALLYFEGDISDVMFAALTTLRARLAQPEPEPVAWHEPGAYGNVTVYKDWAKENNWLPLYTAPPQREWQGLTDEEVGMLTVFDGLHHVEMTLLAKFIRTIEAKLKEKNAADA